MRSCKQCGADVIPNPEQEFCSTTCRDNYEKEMELDQERGNSAEGPWKHYMVKAYVSAYQITGQEDMKDLEHLMSSIGVLPESKEYTTADLPTVWGKRGDWLVIGTTGALFIVSDKQMQDNYIEIG